MKYSNFSVNAIVARSVRNVSGLAKYGSQPSATSAHCRTPRGVRGRTRARATLVLSGLLVALGLALIVETALLGGGLGILLGVLFVLAGGLRLYLSSR